MYTRARHLLDKLHVGEEGEEGREVGVAHSLGLGYSYGYGLVWLQLFLHIKVTFTMLPN